MKFKIPTKLEEILDRPIGRIYDVPYENGIMRCCFTYPEDIVLYGMPKKAEKTKYEFYRATFTVDHFLTYFITIKLRILKPI